MEKAQDQLTFTFETNLSIRERFAILFGAKIRFETKVQGEKLSELEGQGIVMKIENVKVSSKLTKK